MRMVVVACLLTVVIVLGGASAVSAQQMLGPNPIVGGVPVQCGGVPSVVQPIADMAMARPGLILLNPMLFALHPKLQLFIYAHECGHFVLGSDEAAADCWAIRTGRDQGWFAPSDITLLQAMFANNPGDWTHAPGPQRVARMVACYGLVRAPARPPDADTGPDTSKGPSRSSSGKHGTLAAGASTRIALMLRKDHAYTITGTCDDDCTDLDLVLRLHGEEIDRDDDPDDNPIVSVSPDGTASYSLEVKMIDCDADRCSYDIDVDED